MAGVLGLAAVVADAAMLDTALGPDVRQDDGRAAPGAPRVGKGGVGALFGDTDDVLDDPEAGCA